jgi:RNA polymerase sigma-70 factor, ECF subfamily
VAKLQDISDATALATVDFDAVYRAHVDRVARWAARLGGPAVDVDDVVQDVFIVVHRKIAGFRGESSLATWLYRITANVVRDRRRRDRWRRFLSGLVPDFADKMTSPGATPIEMVEQREAIERVYRVLDGMNERYRSLIVLFEIEKLTGEQIAELVGVRESTLWVVLHRARAQFGERLARLQRDEKEEAP